MYLSNQISNFMQFKPSLQTYRANVVVWFSITILFLHEPRTSCPVLRMKCVVFCINLLEKYNTILQKFSLIQAWHEYMYVVNLIDWYVWQKDRQRDRIQLIKLYYVKLVFKQIFTNLVWNTQLPKPRGDFYLKKERLNFYFIFIQRFKLLPVCQQQQRHSDICIFICIIHKIIHNSGN